MNPDDVRKLVAMRLEQTEETLVAARLLLQQGTVNRSVVNRAYYAAFYSVLALLQTIGEIPRKHKGALTLYDSKFVLPGYLSRDSAKRLHRLFELRIEDDYKKTEPVSDSEAAEALEMAEQFVREVREYLGKQGFLQRP